MKCYNCGGEVLVNEESGIGICLSCAAEIPVPKETVAPARFEKANVFLSESRFDEAKEIFTELLIDNPLDAAVCWGLAVSEYGIEYVTDPATGNLVPTLHRLSNTSFSDYIYTKQAVQYAFSNEMKEFYETQSVQIDRIQAESLQISSRENPYDVFICYKRMENEEKRTADARIAADYYKELTRRGYKVFFAEVTLTAGEEYEPRIFAALQSARVMIAIASRMEYYEAVWVRNEWSRYASLVEEKPEERTLIPVYSHMTHDQLPEALKVQPHYVEMDSLANPRQTLLGLVAGQFEKESTGNDFTAVRRQTKTEGYSRDTADIGESAENYLVRATGLLVNEEYEKAAEYFDRSNQMEPSPDAYLGLLMCSLKIPGREALGRYDQLISGEEYYRKALDMADGAQKADVEAVAETCRRNTEWRQTCEQKFEECSGNLNELYRAMDKGSGKDVPGLEKVSRLDALIGKGRQMQIIRSYGLCDDLTLSIWLIGINLIPSFIFALRTLMGYGSGQPSVISSVSVVAGMIQLVGNFILTSRTLRQADILSEGFIRTIIRLALSGVAAFLIAGFEVSKAYIAFLVILVVVSVIVFKTTNRAFWGAGTKLRQTRKLIRAEGISAEDLGGMITGAVEKNFSNITDPMEQYHYDQNAWDEMLQRMHQSCSEAARKFADDISTRMKKVL